jgi:hypothetical protein
MQASNLKPAYQFAQNYGVKMLAYGGAGSGKTPLAQSAPRPLLLAVEPGMLSVKEKHFNMPTWGAFTIPLLEEFMKWFFTSAEAKNFDTLCVDSMSQVAEMYLAKELSKPGAHGLKAYGNMAEAVMNIATPLYYMQQKHIYLICHEGIETVGEASRYRPIFQGKELNRLMPHLYDEIVRLERMQVPTQVKPIVGMRTLESFNAMARDRSGKLADVELPPQGQQFLNLSDIFAKCMS